MGQRYAKINDNLKHFIQQQKIFFVGTAAREGRVNISPKGMDTLRVISETNVVWLNLTGSGNETAAHIHEQNRMTLMFAAFQGSPMILRLYGQATIFHPRDAEWDKLISIFPPIAGARQIIDMRVDLVLTSCGMAVPIYEFKEERDELKKWAGKKGVSGIKKYWEDNNQISLDHKPTQILGEP